MTIMNEKEVFSDFIGAMQDAIYWRGIAAISTYPSDSIHADRKEQEALYFLYGCPVSIDYQAVAGLIKSAEKHHFQLTDEMVTDCCATSQVSFECY